MPHLDETLGPVPGLAAATSALRGAAQWIGAWLEARERVAADRHALAGMSDRELLDIGIDRASVNAIAGEIGNTRLR
jgi:uncharacterized protein YjiS (DUF1127 family)